MDFGWPPICIRCCFMELGMMYHSLSGRCRLLVGGSPPRDRVTTAGSSAGSPPRPRSASPPAPSSAPCSTCTHSRSKHPSVLNIRMCTCAVFQGGSHGIILQGRWMSRQFCSILLRILWRWCWAPVPGPAWPRSRATDPPDQRWPPGWYLETVNLGLKTFMVPGYSGF